MSTSQSRPSRHQRRASQSVFVLPEDFAVADQVVVEGAADKKPGFHRSTKSMSIPPAVSIIEEIPEPRTDAFAKNAA